MSRTRNAALVALLAAVFSASCAQIETGHAHHEAGPPAGASSARAGTMMSMEGPMKGMREMHEKWAAAKTQEERNALMAAHMKAMQDGMGALQSGGSPPADMQQRQHMMEKRMEMMQSMMQMMMDRMPASPAR